MTAVLAFLLLVPDFRGDLFWVVDFAGDLPVLFSGVFTLNFFIDLFDLGLDLDRESVIPSGAEILVMVD